MKWTRENEEKQYGPEGDGEGQREVMWNRALNGRGKFRAEGRTMHGEGDHKDCCHHHYYSVQFTSVDGRGIAFVTAPMFTFIAHLLLLLRRRTRTEPFVISVGCLNDLVELRVS